MKLTKIIKHGVSRQVLSKLLRQLFAWCITFYVIRLLEPTDYGIVAITSVLIAFMHNFSELGMGSAIINFDEIDSRQLGQVFTISIVVNLLLFVIVYSLAPFIAEFYENELLIEALRVSSC